MHLLTSIIFAATGTISVALGISAFGSLLVGSLTKAYSLSGFAKDLQRQVGMTARMFHSANEAIRARGETNFWHPNYVSVDLQSFARIEGSDDTETLEVLVLAAEYEYLTALAAPQWKQRPVMELVYQIMVDQPRRRAVVQGA